MDNQETQQNIELQGGGTAKYIVGIIILGLIILGVSFMNKSRPTPASTNTTNTTTQTPPVQNGTTTAKTFTMADVVAHNNKDNCYTAVRGSVYDLTSFIYQHPGGAARILALCGIDGTSAFEGKHGGQTRPEAELISLKIGELIK